MSWPSFQLGSIMSPSHRYLPEGQGVLVGLEDPKDRVASVSETSPVFISISHGFYQQESVPSWIFGTSQQPVPKLLKERGWPHFVPALGTSLYTWSIPAASLVPSPLSSSAVTNATSPGTHPIPGVQVPTLQLYTC